MNKDFDVLFKENKENGIKVMKNLDRGKMIALISIYLHLIAIVGMLCLLFLDMAPVLRIIWEIILFVYFGVSFVEDIIDLVRVLKAKYRVKIMHDLLSGLDSKDNNLE